MFSVGARPFNSTRRQLYGGWTAGAAMNNLWALRAWNEMSAKYNPDAAEKLRSKEWLKAYRLLPKDYRKGVSASGRPYWNKAIKPRLSDEAKAAIWHAWEAIPLTTDDGLAQYRSNLFRRAPYPPIRVLNTYPYVTAPRSMKIEGMADLGDGDYVGMYRTMRDMMNESRAIRRQNTLAALNARADRIAARFPAQVPNIVPPVPPALNAQQQALAQAAAAAEAAEAADEPMI